MAPLGKSENIFWDFKPIYFAQKCPHLQQKKVHEDVIFVRQGILQFFSAESIDYKYLKSP